MNIEQFCQKEFNNFFLNKKLGELGQLFLVCWKSLLIDE
jgi:hypothetical protein